MADSKGVNNPDNTVLERITSAAVKAAIAANNYPMLREYINARVRRKELRQAIKQCEDNFKQYRENVIKNFEEG